MLGDRRLARLLGTEARTPALAERQAAFGNRAVELWFATAPGAEDARLRLCAYAFAGALDAFALAWTEDDLELTVDQVIDELVVLFHRMIAGL